MKTFNSHYMERLPLRIFIAIGIILLLFNGCTNTKKSISKTQFQLPQKSNTILSNPLTVKQILYTQYTSWKDTPYKFGGLSKKGIDCSGFVYLTYKDLFGIILPRTTKQLKNIGSQIARHQLLPGDLIFFKSGVLSRHVGIFIENNIFLHSSKSKGVILSDLQEQYWQDTYWKSQRVMTH